MAFVALRRADGSSPQPFSYVVNATLSRAHWHQRARIECSHFHQLRELNECGWGILPLSFLAVLRLEAPATRLPAYMRESENNPLISQRFFWFSRPASTRDSQLILYGRGQRDYHTPLEIEKTHTS